MACISSSACATQPHPDSHDPHLVSVQETDDQGLTWDSPRGNANGSGENSEVSGSEGYSSASPPQNGCSPGRGLSNDDTWDHAGIPITGSRRAQV